MLLPLLIVLLIEPSINISICSKRQSTLGKILSTFTEPWCSAWCRIRNCGSGQCTLTYKSYADRDDRYECVCDRCRNPNNLYSGSGYYQLRR